MRIVLVVAGAGVSALWYRLYSDPLAALIILLGAVLAWAVALVRGEEFGAGHILVGGTVGLVVVGATLRIITMIEAGDTSGSIIGGFVGQGAFLAAGFAIAFLGIEGKPWSEVFEDSAIKEGDSTSSQP